MNEWKLQDCVLALSREIMLFIGFPRGTSVWSPSLICSFKKLLMREPHLGISICAVVSVTDRACCIDIQRRYNNQVRAARLWCSAYGFRPSVFVLLWAADGVASGVCVWEEGLGGSRWLLWEERREREIGLGKRGRRQEIGCCDDTFW